MFEPRRRIQGRVYAVCYDLSGTSKDTVYDKIVADWKRLIDEKKITQDERYLHHDGKPVLFVWGFYSERFDAATAHHIIDFFKTEPKYAVTLVGGCQWYWRAEKGPRVGAGVSAIRRDQSVECWEYNEDRWPQGGRHGLLER